VTARDRLLEREEAARPATLSGAPLGRAVSACDLLLDAASVLAIAARSQEEPGSAPGGQLSFCYSGA